MEFKKLVIVGLVMFIGINAILTILWYLFSASSGGLLTLFTSDILKFIGSMFDKLSDPPSDNWFLFITSITSQVTHGFRLDVLINGLSVLIAPLLVVILLIKSAEEKREALKAWVIIVMISMAVYMVMAFVFNAYGGSAFHSDQFVILIVDEIRAGFINLMIYGTLIMLLYKDLY